MKIKKIIKALSKKGVYVVYLGNGRSIHGLVDFCIQLTDGVTISGVADLCEFDDITRAAYKSMDKRN